MFCSRKKSKLCLDDKNISSTFAAALREKGVVIDVVLAG
jgi:hypothetical protein